MENFEFTRMKIGTVELKGGLNPNGKIEDFCDKTISGEIFDKETNFFNEKNKKEAFGENYKEKNIIKIIDVDGSEKEINIPSIINGGMGTNVSSSSLVVAMNEIGFGGHLSSVGIGFYHYQEKYPNLFNEDFSWNKELSDNVRNDFNSIFKDKLGLSEEFINKHFFVCDELCDNKNPNKKNKGFNAEKGRAKVARMMDLVAIYKEVTNLKSTGKNVGINCMYKTSSYFAALKVATLAGIDYITTAAGNPPKNPKIFIKDFYEDLKKENPESENTKKFSLPAFGLLASTGNKRIFTDFDYDYYIFEEGDKAGGHVLRMGEKFEELKKIRELFKQKGLPIPPIYAAGGVSTNKEIREVFDGREGEPEIKFDGVQIGTLPAVSKEACNGKGEEFKKRLIGLNHLGENTKIDEDFFTDVEYTKKHIEKIFRVFNKLILRNLSRINGEKYTEETPEIKKVKDYIYRIVYDAFFTENIQDFESLSDKEKELYFMIKKFVFESNGGDIEKISKVFRDYCNAKLFLQEFEKYENTNGIMPSFIICDSTAGFPGSMKIIKRIHEIIIGKINSLGCISCLTDCIHAGRGNVRADRGSTFCIYNRLNYLNPDKNIAFSGKSTVPYDEIRPLKDIIAYLMGYYVER